jgi:hypothetical protein
VRTLTTLDAAKWSRLTQAMTEAGRELDFLLFDTAPAFQTTARRDWPR